MNIFSHSFFLLEVGHSYQSTQFLNTYSLPVFQYFVMQFSTLSWHPAQLTFSLLDCFNPACHFNFLCVAFQPTILSFVLTLPNIRQFVHSFALQWLPPFIPLGTSAQQIFGPWLLFRTSKYDSDDLTTPVALLLQLHRLNFARRMRRNRTSGSASSRPNSQRQGSDLKNLSMPMF